MIWEDLRGDIFRTVRIPSPRHRGLKRQAAGEQYRQRDCPNPLTPSQGINTSSQEIIFSWLFYSVSLRFSKASLPPVMR